MSIFLDAFWPNLAATLIGVVLGVLIALGLNERVLSHQRKLQIADHHRQVMDAFEVLMTACRYNIGVLDTMREEAESGRVMHSPDLRITTWDAVAPVLCTSTSPELLQLLSHHWLRLKRIQALSDEIFAREVAKSLPPIEDQSVMREFWKVLHGNALNLSVHAKQAIAMLEQMKAQLKGGHAA